MRRGRALATAAAVLLCAVPAVLLCRGYLQDRHLLTDEHDRLEAAIAERDARIMLLAKARQRVVHSLGLPLGANLEQASATVRSTLLEAAERCGLADPTVTAAPPEPLISPLVKTRIPEFRARALRSKPDALLLRATLSGKAAPEQALRTIALLDGQPWVIGLQSFSMRPIGKSRDRVDLSIEVAGWFAPDVAAAPGRSPDIVELSPAAAAPWSGIHARNPFTPAPNAQAVVARAPDPAVPARAARQPLADWRLTAIAAGERGPEVWLVHSDDGRTRTLFVGDTLEGASLLSASGESARLKFGEAEFEVSLGQSLADRIPAMQ